MDRIVLLDAGVIGLLCSSPTLPDVIEKLITITLTFEAWARAAEFWTFVRKTGRPTADRHALDGDSILAGVAATTGSPGDEVVIAATNVGHPARFPGFDAHRWDAIV